MIAKELISSIIPVLHPVDTGTRALRLMNEYHLSHLPLVVEEKYMGLVEEEEILDWDDPDMLLEAMHLDEFRPSVKEYDQLLEVLKVCSEYKLTAVPVVTNENHLLGMITQEGLVQSLTHITGAREAGGVLVLEMEAKDYSVAEIGRIAESNDVILLSIYAYTDTSGGLLNVLLKTNRIDLQALKATFERFNYTVKFMFTEKDGDNELQKNYDLFMNYLSM